MMNRRLNVMGDFMTAFYAVFMGWCFGFVSFAILDMFSTRKAIKAERDRHDMVMARIKASKSVAR